MTKKKKTQPDGEDSSSSVVKRLLNFLWTVCILIFWFVWMCLTILLVGYILISGLVIYSTELKMEFIFFNRVRGPWFGNISACRDFGVVKCENFFLDGPSGKLGSWFISPASRQYITKEAYILYLHGNMASRAFDHRVQLYKRLSKMGYHILAIDYRGFGDSEGWPTEQGLVEDSKVAYRFLLEKARGHPIYIWGHSLGSAVAVQLAAWLNSEHSQLNGVFLEAPFNNITDGIKYSPLAAPLRQFLPNVEQYFDDVRNVFRSTHWITKVTSPILMLHDKKDHILNINLGRKLHLAAKSVGTTNVKFIELDEDLYHNDIYRAKNLKHIVSDFVFHTS